MKPGDLVRLSAEFNDFYLYREVLSEDMPHLLGSDTNLLDIGTGVGLVLRVLPRITSGHPSDLARHGIWVHVLFPDGIGYADSRWLEMVHEEG